MMCEALEGAVVVGSLVCPEAVVGCDLWWRAWARSALVNLDGSISH